MNSRGDLRDYYKEHYFLEVSRRNDLTNRLSLPLGILVLLIADLVPAAQAMHVPPNEIDVLQLALIAAAVLFILLTAFYLFRSYYKYRYGYVPTPLEIQNFKDDLATYYIAVGEPPADVPGKTALNILMLNMQCMQIATLRITIAKPTAPPGKIIEEHVDPSKIQEMTKYSRCAQSINVRVKLHRIVPSRQCQRARRRFLREPLAYSFLCLRAAGGSCHQRTRARSQRQLEYRAPLYS